MDYSYIIIGILAIIALCTATPTESNTEDEDAWAYSSLNPLSSSYED